MSAWRIALLMGLLALVPTPARAAEQHDMRLVGDHDLQARSAYQPVIHQQGGRFIAYVGHHGGRGSTRSPARWSRTAPPSWT